MRELALVGFIALAFGVGSYYATDHLGAFGIANLAGGGLALALALLLALARMRSVGGPHSRAVIGRGLLGVLLAVALAVGAERAAHWSGLRWDWTFERRYELAPALAELLREMPGLRILLFYDAEDPRIRRTRLLVEELSRVAGAQTAEYDLDHVPDELESYGVSASNTLVFEFGNDAEVVERPLEGAIYEALYRLRSVRAGVIGILRGEGEGDPELGKEPGFGGLSAALATEGYELRSLVTHSLREVPAEVNAVLAIAPQRKIGEHAIGALERFLERGGSLIALLEPGVNSGLEDLLARWGIRSPDEVVVDPASGEGLGHEPDGICPLAYNYETDIVTRGLGPNRMTFFCGARPFELHKPEVDDELHPLVYASPRAWLSQDLGVLRHGVADKTTPPASDSYPPIAVKGRYKRGDVETRIFAVGDSDFASNRYLRALYNLDLIMNGVHWALAREPQITLRPKIRETVQFPLPVQNTVQMLYGIGLLLPELLLILAGLLWLRRRAA